MAEDRAYRIQLAYQPDEETFLASVPELDVSAAGATRAEAIEKVESELEATFEKAAVDGEELPSPADLNTEAGQVEVELAAPLWRDLQYHAQAQGLEVNELAAQLLGRALGHLNGRPRRRTKDGDAQPKEARESAPAEGNAKREGGGRRNNNNRNRNRGRREGYRPDMDDQDNFLAYVRDQEKGGRGRR